jgi:hypothetical protein
LLRGISPVYSWLVEQIPCPDGFLLDPRSELAEGHHALNDYLLREEQAGWQTAIKEINGIRDKARKLVIWKALIERMAWLRDDHSRSRHLSSLRGLAERIEKWTLAPSEADLIAILRSTANAGNYLAPNTPIPHVFAYIDAKGLSPEMAAAIREFRELMFDEGLAVNQVSYQLFRSRLDMLAWRDEWTPIDLERCWSERIRADYRAMEGSERKAWRSLLYCIHGDEGTRPSGKWLKETQKAMEAIGRDAFRVKAAEWLGLLKAGSVWRLSREGSHILRAFIWLAEASNEPELLSLLPAIAEVQFKPKANGQKVVKAVRDLVANGA